MKKEKIVVSFTSWVERAKEDIRPVIESILGGSLVPDEIILNLSKEEWDGTRDADAFHRLKDLEMFSEQHPEFRINMVEGPNTKCFKKFLPILDAHKDDIIITIDDDIIYPVNFVEKLVEKFKEDETRPVTVSYYNYKGLIVMWGGGALYKASFLEGWKEKITDEIIGTYEDDWFYSYMLLINGIKPRICPDEIYYSPFVYMQYTYNNQMFNHDGYNTAHTIDVLDKWVKGQGLDTDELIDKVFAKYKYSI